MTATPVSHHFPTTSSASGQIFIHPQHARQPSGNMKRTLSQSEVESVRRASRTHPGDDVKPEPRDGFSPTQHQQNITADSDDSPNSKKRRMEEMPSVQVTQGSPRAPQGVHLPPIRHVSSDAMLPPRDATLADRRGHLPARSLSVKTPAYANDPNFAQSIQSAPLRPAPGHARPMPPNSARMQVPNSASIGSIMAGAKTPKMGSFNSQIHNNPPTSGSSLGSSSGHSRHSPSNAPPTPVSGGSHPNKAAFLGLFDTFYDALADSRTLQSNLDAQLRRSNLLLQTLQQSSTLFEQLVESKTNELCKSLTKDLQMLEGRIQKLEEAQGLSKSPVGQSSLSTSMPGEEAGGKKKRASVSGAIASGKKKSEAAKASGVIASISERLDSLEQNGENGQE